jgi:hypothetical protein
MIMQAIDMSEAGLDHKTLHALARGGALHALTVVGQSGGWRVVVRWRAGESTLTAQRSGAVRVFRRFETVVQYLRAMGVPRFEVDISGYAAADTAQSRRAVAASNRMKRAHRAAAQTSRLRQEVEQALRDSHPQLAGCNPDAGDGNTDD